MKTARLRLQAGDTAKGLSLFRMGMRDFSESRDQYGHPVFQKELLRTLLASGDIELALNVAADANSGTLPAWAATLVARAYSRAGDLALARAWWAEAAAVDLTAAIEAWDRHRLHTRPEIAVRLSGEAHTVDRLAVGGDAPQVRPVGSADPYQAGCYVFSDLTVCGIGYLIYQDKLLQIPSLFPEYIRHIHQKQRYGDIIRSARLPRRQISEPCIVCQGFGWNNYGHVIIEFLPRLLLALAVCSEDGISPKVLLRSDTPQWVLDMLTEHVGLHPDDVLMFDADREAVDVRTAVVPTYLYRARTFHPAVSPLFQGLRGLPDREDTSVATRYFVSRRSVTTAPDARRLLNEDELLRIAEDDFGFQCISPETLPWKDQVRMFRQSSCIVGQYGSALHTALFAGPDLVIGTLGHLNTVQADIGRFLGQTVKTVDVSRGSNGLTVDAQDFAKFLAALVQTTVASDRSDDRPSSVTRPS